MARRKPEREPFAIYPSMPDELQKAMSDLDATFKRSHNRELAATATAGMTRANGWSLDEAFDLESVLNELNQRNSEALSIIQPVPGMSEFFECDAGEVGVIGSNRSGKTLSVGIKVANVVCGRWRNDQFPKENGVASLIGPTLRHTSLFYRTLFKPGQFKVLKTKTGWKVPRYDDPEDVARKKEWQPGPPLIPERMIASVTWENVKEEQPVSVRLTNGWVLNFFSFEADPVQGVFWHIAWMDEESPRARVWLSEVRARLMSVKGYMIWSATPENATATFYGLQSRANRPDMKDKSPYKQTKFFQIFSKDNPYLDPEAREALVERLTEDDPDAAVAKIEGDWAFKKYLVYPEFDDNKHIIEPFEIEWRDTVYVMLDPSRTRCAMLMCAMLHPESPHFVKEQPDRIVVFDEIVIKNCNAFKASRALAEKMNDHYKHWIEYIVIDWQHGRKKDESETEVATYYWDEFQEVGIKPRLNQWVQASNNVEGGIMNVAQHLDQKNGLPPKFVIMRDKCPYTVWEFKRYYRIKNPDGSPGKPFQRTNDLVDCARYACSAGLVWVTPPGQQVNANSYSAEELRAIDKNPRLFYYTNMFGDPTKRQRRQL
jgi:hypothetical protein